MTIILILSILSLLLLLLITFLYYRQEPQAEEVSFEMPIPRGRSLFSDPEEINARRLQDELEDNARQQSHREALLERARQGDLAALHNAWEKNDPLLYREVLNALVMLATSSFEAEERLRSLVAYLLQQRDLRTSTELAAEVMTCWNESPDKQTLGEMLRVAALADDATVYRMAIETAVEFWKRGCLPDVSASYLLMLIESEFWIISAEARKTSAGLSLRKILNNIRRELAGTNGQQA